jgi:hypothetical protein
MKKSGLTYMRIDDDQGSRRRINMKGTERSKEEKLIL